MSPDGTGAHTLSDDPDSDYWPTWSHDGSWIAFQRSVGHPAYDVHLAHPDGSDPSRLELPPTGAGGFLVWAPDDSAILTFLHEVSSRACGLWSQGDGNVDSHVKRTVEHGIDVVEPVDRTRPPNVLSPCRSPLPMADNAPVEATSQDLTAAWREAQARLPAGWSVDGLRCSSTGLDDAQRSDDWVAVAVGPRGEERRHRAPDPIAALAGLAMSFEGPTRA